MFVEMLKENYGAPLKSRHIGGIYVGMFYSEGEVYIGYSDVGSGLSFTLNPPKFLANDAYHHPIVYFRGEMNGTSNPNRLNPADIDTYAHA